MSSDPKASAGTEANITAQQVKQLREQTGAGWMDCKTALKTTGGSVEEAVAWLRKKGMATAQRKAGRATSEGIVGSYVHAGDKIGVLVEVNCETDFVARTEPFRQLVHDLAMHIAAAEPRFIRREEVTPDVLARERDIYREQALASGKPEKVVDRIVEGKLDKFYEENCLYEQHFIRDDKMTVKERIDSVVAQVGENIAVRCFSRYKVGDSSLVAEAAPPAEEGAGS
ncbi:MAG TPA: translation elongation factor Ts [Candidatus Acidoferrales bacterium]|nr:translation elongation factor Ts [Candidatus Acidoferrales bacterium]